MCGERIDSDCKWLLLVSITDFVLVISDVSLERQLSWGIGAGYLNVTDAKERYYHRYRLYCLE